MDAFYVKKPHFFIQNGHENRSKVSDNKNFSKQSRYLYFNGSLSKISKPKPILLGRGERILDHLVLPYSTTIFSIKNPLKGPPTSYPDISRQIPQSGKCRENVRKYQKMSGSVTKSREMSGNVGKCWEMLRYMSGYMSGNVGVACVGGPP